MPATNNELEVLVQRARTESVDPARLGSGGATSVGVALVWDGNNWVPGIPAIDDTTGAVEDLDGEVLLDLDGQPIFEPGEAPTGGGTWAGLDVFEWVQATPVQTWVLTHGRGALPINVQVSNAGGVEVQTTVLNPTTSTTWIRWGYPATGTARLLFK